MLKKYKILLSAYACEPNRGSEPGVGWNWAIEIAKRGHEVRVLTRANNKNLIEAYWANNPKPNNLQFLYYDLPKSLSFWKRNGHGVHLYYFLWQIAVYLKYRKSIIEENFDFMHHITFVTIHQPSFLFLIKKIPFFYGPAAGGDEVRIDFLKSFPIKAKIKEFLIIIQNKLFRIDPMRQKLLAVSNLFFVNSISTLKKITHKKSGKIHCNLAIGSNAIEDVYFNNNKTNQIQLLYVGNFLHWKGLHLAIKSHAILNDSNCIFTIIGKGDKSKFNIQKTNITVIDWISQDELKKYYQESTVFVFPSFRDSGGMVVLEALSFGLPVICLDLGGPGQIVDETCGRLIETQNKTEDEIVNAIVSAISELTSNPELLIKLKYGAIERAKYFSWKNTVGSVYEKIENYMDTYVKN